MRTKLIANSICLIMLFWVGCTDKYIALRKVDAAPIIEVDKEVMTVRVADYSNYNHGAGFISVTARDTLASGMNLFAFDSTSHLEVFYDSARLEKPLPINQATVLYVASKDTGVYYLTVRIADRLGKETLKHIPVTVVPNEPPVASLYISAIETTTGRVVFKIDGSASKSRMGRVVSYTYYIDGLETTLFQPSIKSTLYSGTHTIGLVVADDLGAKSIIKTEKVTIP